jgi:glycosyltransferase involved in cell wall biosynthesis
MQNKWPYINPVDPEVYKNRTDWPKISIITPSYNQGQFIEETILSILNQNYPNLEYIIIDGGSTDNSVEIIKKYEDRITYWVSENDKGQSDAINKGIKIASGDLFNWLNSDDLLAENALLNLGLTYHQDKNVYLMDTSIVNLDNTQTIFTYKQKIGSNVSKTILDHLIAQPSTFYKLNIIKHIGTIAEEFHFVMDLFLWVRYLLEFGQSHIVEIEALGAYYREHPNTKTKLLYKKFELETIDVFNFALQLAKNRSPKKHSKFANFNVHLNEEEKLHFIDDVKKLYFFLIKKNIRLKKFPLAARYLKEFIFSL